MSVLFEYGDPINITDREALEDYLRALWNDRKYTVTDELENEQEGSDKKQPFLKFDGNKVQAKNYVGFIQNGQDVIEIYPKVFRSLPHDSKGLMLKHMFHWFNYCRKWKLPHTRTTLDLTTSVSFPELLINLIANQFLEAVSTHPYMTYQYTEEALLTPRGSINYSRYINQSIVYGNNQRIECDYEPFIYDNHVNRIIKYCSRVLLHLTKLPETLKIIQEILFVLDEVDDTFCTIQDVHSVNINPLFTEYYEIMDSCRMLLMQQLYSNASYDLNQWCLLLPMESIFEDFFAGFLYEHCSGSWNVEYQKSNMYLVSDPSAFLMKHDIFLTSRSDPSRKIIIDTKYKLREYDTDDKKKGVSQSDLYQMVSYAFRRGCTEVVLVYPNLSDELRSSEVFTIASGFHDDNIITVKTVEIPFWSSHGADTLDHALSQVVNDEILIGT
jgi:5-methylcytosine-specific restriction enzyme subunit McrC